MLEVAIRVDASIEMGTGHVMRCLTLAEELRNNNATVIFISREQDGHLCDFIESKGFKVKRIIKDPKNDIFGTDQLGETKHANWLGSSQRKDAEQTLEIIGQLSETIDLLIVDHYSLDHRWETMVNQSVKYIMIIDDLADRRHYCHVLLDQNYNSSSKSRYTDLVPSFCKVLEGPKYSLLRQEFIRARDNLLQRNGNINRILVFFGGSDPSNETKKAIEAILLTSQKDIWVDVVVGESNPNKDEIRYFVDPHPNINFHLQINNMAELMGHADLAIGAGGSTTWERCCLGLPSLVMSIADNQKYITECVAKTGSIIDLGYASQVFVQDIADRLTQLITSPQTVKMMSNNSLSIVDGKGVERVVNLIKQSGYKTTIVSDKNSWINAYIPKLVDWLQENGHDVNWIHAISDIQGGDFTFYLGCGQLTPTPILEKSRHNLVIHGSALPQGKGWSPLTWQILEGKNKIPMTLFEAVDKVDSGTVYLQDTMVFEGHELIDELREEQGNCSIRLCITFLKNYPEIVKMGYEQTGESTYYAKRTLKDSKIDPEKTILEQFNLLRVVDNERYPAFFELNDQKYLLKIEKIKK